MPLIYINSTLQATLALESVLSVVEEEYATRLHEVESALLCQALGGRAPQPDGQLRLQRYLNGEISRAEAFQPSYQTAGR